MSESETRRVGGTQFVPRPSQWRSGEFPAWRADQPLQAEAVLALVSAAGLDRAPLPPTFADARPSAVLVVLVDGPTGAEVLLTKRSPDLRHHAGEISFPGGRIEAGESALSAALREADEEVGLLPSLVEVGGRLSALSTVVSRSYIIPVVGTVQTKPLLVAHDREVARIMWVPLVELVRTDTYREEWWGTPPLDRRMDFFDLDDETIWGATGRMLHELLWVVYGPPATRTVL